MSLVLHMQKKNNNLTYRYSASLFAHKEATGTVPAYLHTKKLLRLCSVDQEPIIRRSVGLV